MVTFWNDFLSQIDEFFKRILVYLKDSPISIVFLIFIVVVFVLNIIKRVIIYLEKKHGARYQSCMFLVVEANKQDCNLPSHRTYFKENENGCDGCTGKTINMTDADAEIRIVKSSAWKKVVVILANYGKNALPYISFFYTLIITIFEKNN